MVKQITRLSLVERIGQPTKSYSFGDFFNSARNKYLRKCTLWCLSGLDPCSHLVPPQEEHQLHCRRTATCPHARPRCCQTQETKRVTANASAKFSAVSTACLRVVCRRRLPRRGSPAPSAGRACHPRRSYLAVLSARCQTGSSTTCRACPPRSRTAQNLA